MKQLTIRNLMNPDNSIWMMREVRNFVQQLPYRTHIDKLLQDDTVISYLQCHSNFKDWLDCNNFSLPTKPVLKPCLFCEADEDQLFISWGIYGEEDIKFWYVGCKICDAMGPHCKDRDTAIKLWNRDGELGV